YTTFEGISDTLTKVFLFSGGLGFEQELEFEPVGDSELLAYVPAGTPPGEYALFAVGKGGQSNPLSLRVSGTVVAGSVLDPFAGLQLAVEPGSLKGNTLLDLRDPEGRTVQVDPNTGTFAIFGLDPGSYLLRYVKGPNDETDVVDAFALEFEVLGEDQPIIIEQPIQLQVDPGFKLLL